MRLTKKLRLCYKNCMPKGAIQRNLFRKEKKIFAVTPDFLRRFLPVSFRFFFFCGNHLLSEVFFLLGGPLVLESSDISSSYERYKHSNQLWIRKMASPITFTMVTSQELWRIQENSFPWTLRFFFPSPFPFPFPWTLFLLAFGRRNHGGGLKGFRMVKKKFRSW